MLEKKKSIHDLQEELLSKTTGDEYAWLEDDKSKTLITNYRLHRLRERKVLVILDDRHSSEQLKALAGEPNWFGCGSIIIITMRDNQLLDVLIGFIARMKKTMGKQKKAHTKITKTMETTTTLWEIRCQPMPSRANPSSTILAPYCGEIGLSALVCVGGNGSRVQGEEMNKKVVYDVFKAWATLSFRFNSSLPIPIF